MAANVCLLSKDVVFSVLLPWSTWIPHCTSLHHSWGHTSTFNFQRWWIEIENEGSFIKKQKTKMVEYNFYFLLYHSSSILAFGDFLVKWCPAILICKNAHWLRQTRIDALNAFSYLLCFFFSLIHSLSNFFK
jgi:hypothetical protein